MIKNVIIGSCAIFLLSILLAGCTSNNNSVSLKELQIYKSPVKGFTKEIDEPSARGQITRISPELSNSIYRFELSHDEKFIVFSGYQTGSNDRQVNLWKISSDGLGSPVKITSGGSDNYYYPSFTSNNAYLVYTAGGQIWRVRSDGAGGKMKIPGSGYGNDTAPHISINDKVVFTSLQSNTVYSSITYTYLIWTSNLDGSELTQIREGNNPRWSPDGEKIVFNFKTDVWMIDKDGTNLMQLTNTSNIFEALPTFSPDGTKIAYISDEGKDGKPTNDFNIWTMDIDGSGKTQITELNSWDSWPLWANSGLYFLSARAQKTGQSVQRIWKLKM